MPLILTLCLGSVLYLTIRVNIRVNNVAEFRRGLIDEIHQVGRADIEAGKNWRWRWDEWDKVSFDYMVLHFWKPLKPEVWWEDTKFLEP